MRILTLIFVFSSFVTFGQNWSFGLSNSFTLSKAHFEEDLERIYSGTSIENLLYQEAPRNKIWIDNTLSFELHRHSKSDHLFSIRYRFLQKGFKTELSNSVGFQNDDIKGYYVSGLTDSDEVSLGYSLPLLIKPIVKVYVSVISGIDIQSKYTFKSYLLSSENGLVYANPSHIWTYHNEMKRIPGIMSSIKLNRFRYLLGIEPSIKLGTFNKHLSLNLSLPIVYYSRLKISESHPIRQSFLPDGNITSFSINVGIIYKWGFE